MWALPLNMNYQGTYSQQHYSCCDFIYFIVLFLLILLSWANSDFLFSLSAPELKLYRVLRTAVNNVIVLLFLCI